MILSLRGKLLASQRSHPQILRQGEAVNYVHVNSVALPWRQGGAQEQGLSLVNRIADNSQAKRVSYRKEAHTSGGFGFTYFGFTKGSDHSATSQQKGQPVGCPLLCDDWFRESA